VILSGVCDCDDDVFRKAIQHIGCSRVIVLCVAGTGNIDSQCVLEMRQRVVDAVRLYDDHSSLSFSVKNFSLL